MTPGGVAAALSGVHHLDPDLESWVESANSRDSDFPIQNLPYGVFSKRGSGTRRLGVAIGACGMQTGNLLGSGTISGPARDSVGSLLERTWNGAEPLALAG